MSTQQPPTGGQEKKEVVDEQALVKTEKPAPLAVSFDPDNPVSVYMDPGAFAQLQRVGNMLASSELVPAHLRGKAGDCALVAAQAFRWRMDPLAVAQGTFVVKGKMGYEGKLVAAAVNRAMARMGGGRLTYEFEGKGPTRTVIVSAKLPDEDKARTVNGSVARWKTENDMWKGDEPDQALSYRGAREWARRHVPEILLGVEVEEEIRAVVDVTPTEQKMLLSPMEQAKERLRAAAPDPTVPETNQAQRERVDEIAKQVFGIDPPREPGSDDDEAAGTPPPSHDCFHEPIHGRSVPQGKVVVCPSCKADVNAVQLRAAEGRYAQAQEGRK